MAYWYSSNLQRLANQKLAELHQKLAPLAERAAQAYASSLIIEQQPSDLFVARAKSQHRLEMPLPTDWNEYMYGVPYIAIDSPASVSWQPGALEKLVRLSDSRYNEELLTDAVKFRDMSRKLLAWLEEQRKSKSPSLSNRQLVTIYPELAHMFGRGAQPVKRPRSRIDDDMPQEIRQILAAECLITPGE